MYGHVSYVIDGISYSFDNEGYHTEDADDYIDRRRQTSGGTAFVLDFGSPELNDKFKQALKDAYKNNSEYSVTSNNCANAFAKAINSIAGQLNNVPTNNNIKPKSHGNYIKKYLKSYTTETIRYEYKKGNGSEKEK